MWPSHEFPSVKLNMNAINLQLLNYFKLQSVAFWGVKNDPKSIFEKMHNQPVFNTICLP